MRPSTQKDTGQVPVLHTDFRPDRPAFWHYEQLNNDREANPFYWNDSTEQGFWMITRYDHVVEALGMTDVFSNRQVNAFDHAAELPLLPNNLDGEAHIKLRALLNPFFTPQIVRRIENIARERVSQMIEEVMPEKSIDFVRGLAVLYPTEMFLTMVGLPAEDGKLMLDWVEGIFDGFFGADEASANASEIGAGNVIAYLKSALNERRVNPEDPATDLMTRMLQAKVDGEPLTEDEILITCMTIMTAGLDTTRSALGYIFHHLANDEELRHWLTANPDQVPAAIDEFIRLYPLVIQDGRQAVCDIDFHGCPIKAGDMIWIGLGSANRDPRKFERPDEFILNRPNIRDHVGFATGQHQCLGKHLARAEIVIALQEWHKRIPDYHIQKGANITERGGQLRLQNLPIVWT